MIIPIMFIIIIVISGCTSSVRLNEDSVILVRIFNAQGNVLAHGYNIPRDKKQRTTLQLLPDSKIPIAPTVAPTLHTQTLGNRLLYYAVAPVVTSSKPQSPRQQNLNSAILLLGQEMPNTPLPPSLPIRLGRVPVALTSTTMQDNIRTAFITGIGITLAIALAGAVAAFIYFNYTLKPVQAMAQAASNIAAGDLSQQVEAASHDEIGVLARTFNQMTVALDQRLTELAALQSIGLVLSSTLEIEQLVSQALNAIVAQLGYDNAALFLVDHEQQALLHGRVAGTGETTRAQVRELRIPLCQESGFYARVALQGKPVLVTDMQQIDDPHDRRLVNMLASRSLVIAPLRVEDRILGILSVGYVEENHVVTSIDQRLVTTLTSQMALALANAMAYHQIEHLNVGLEAQVQARTAELRLRQEELQAQAEQLRSQQVELQKVNDQLDVVSRRKSEFLANMSHELRTPLNAVIGFSHVLLEKIFGDLNGKQVEYIGDILRSGEYLLDLINDVLDLSKIEAGKLDFKPRLFDLKPLLQNSLVMVKEHARTHRIRLSLAIDDGVDQLYGDERQVKQIMFNLLANAVKFTPNGGRVGVEVSQAHDGVQITVWDTGVGIAGEDQQLIFEAFQQAGNGFTPRIKGTGLGLTLTKQFVDLHGGLISVASTPGKGSTFTFTLPDPNGVLVASTPHNALAGQEARG